MTDDYSGRGLRFALVAGLGGIALIFLIATIDAVQLLNAMRAENKILRDSSVQRTSHLASIRSSVLLTHAYLGESLLDSAPRNRTEYLARIEAARSRSLSDLASYRSSTVDEEVRITRLGDLLNEHWKRLSSVLGAEAVGKKPVAASLYTAEILPLRDSFVEITTQLQGIDAKQNASTDTRIENQFELLGAHLSMALGLGLGAAILLAAGCFVYILRIERQNRLRYQQVLKARGALEQLSARLVDAQETERRTISRDLHDQVGQTLNAVLVEAANLAKRIQPEDAVSLKYLDNIRRLADSSVNSIRDIALLLRPSMLDDLGLIPALEWQAREVSRRSGIDVKVVARDEPDLVQDNMRTCVYRVTQEALHNVARHSGARHAVVTVSRSASALVLTVEDDGQGFDPAKTRGLGILGMQERVRQLGGKFEIQSAPGKGTTLKVELLLDNSFSNRVENELRHSV